jgi:hypothetical protein
MDLANNRAGILAAEKLIKNKNFSTDNLIDAGMEELKKGTLSVLEPKIKKGQ